jgi:hypothetical protein
LFVPPAESGARLNTGVIWWLSASRLAWTLATGSLAATDKVAAAALASSGWAGSGVSTARASVLDGGVPVSPGPQAARSMASKARREKRVIGVSNLFFGARYN